MQSSILRYVWAVVLIWVAVHLGCSNRPPQDDVPEEAQSPLANGSIDRRDDYANVAEITWGDTFCSGTLVGCRHVLTAAHCVCGLNSTDSGTLVRTAEACGQHIPVSVQFSFYSDPMHISPIKGIADVQRSSGFRRTHSRK